MQLILCNFKGLIMTQKLNAVFDVFQQVKHSNYQKFSEVNGHTPDEKKIVQEVMEAKTKAAAAHLKKKPAELSALVIKNIEDVTKAEASKWIVIHPNNKAKEEFNRLIHG
jgi:hypothetical protein